MREADIIIAACGIPQFVKADWLGEGQIVIDVGITYGVQNGESNIFGDVEFCEETL